MILVITGVLLMLYYHPSVPQAYPDMKDLQFVVSSGAFLRNLHRWSAHAMLDATTAGRSGTRRKGPGGQRGTASSL